MKKVICFISAIALAISSCSSDKTDATPVSPAKIILPTKIINTSATYTITSTPTYNGDKIIKDESLEVGSSTYTYTGDLITKTVVGASKISTIFLGSTTDYIYENNKLKSSITKEMFGNSGIRKIKTDYIYNVDGTVEFKEYNIDNVTGVEKLNDTGKYTYLNGNVIKNETTSFVATYEYDSKNKPTKNVKGFDKLVYEITSVNNVTKEIRTFKRFSTPIVTTYEYLYNTDGYPTQAKQFIDGKLESTIQYFY